MIEYSGTIIEIPDIKVVGKNRDFEIQELIVEIDSDTKYPQICKFQMTGKNARALQELDAQVGQEIDFSFNIKGREYNGSVYNNLEIWKIQTQSDIPQKSPSQQFHDRNPPPAKDGDYDFIDDNIPF
ncbi:single-stranded DNA-binding protein [uncultured Mediterranean phage uvMED]|jgi:hypothetical protein|nr:single-stranded DNA-binding protein [uncultured Mediterranean phage uvMED]BAQ89024.1 single-stranded DNA-binding protein [uncultured Mediterranean phage uvMED]